MNLINEVEDSDHFDSQEKFSAEKVSALLGKTQKIMGTFASIKQDEFEQPSSMREESVEESGQMPEEDEFDDLSKKSVKIYDILDSGNFYQSEDEAGSEPNDDILDDYLNIQIEPQVFLKDDTQTKQENEAIQQFIMDEIFAALKLHMELQS